MSQVALIVIVWADIEGVPSMALSSVYAHTELYTVGDNHPDRILPARLLFYFLSQTKCLIISLWHSTIKGKHSIPLSTSGSIVMFTNISIS